MKLMKNNESCIGEIIDNFKEDINNFFSVFMLDKYINNIRYLYNNGDIFIFDIKMKDNILLSLIHISHHVNFNMKNFSDFLFIKNRISNDENTIYMKLSSYSNKNILMWKRLVDVSPVNNNYNIMYDNVLHILLNQKYLGELFLTLKINFIKKIAKIYLISKNSQMFTIFKSSINNLKEIFDKNHITLSACFVNNKSIYQNIHMLELQNVYSKILYSSFIFKKHIKGYFFNKINFTYVHNNFFPAHKIDIYI